MILNSGLILLGHPLQNSLERYLPNLIILNHPPTNPHLDPKTMGNDHREYRHTPGNQCIVPKATYVIILLAQWANFQHSQNNDNVSLHKMPMIRL